MSDGGDGSRPVYRTTVVPRSDTICAEKETTIDEIVARLEARDRENVLVRSHDESRPVKKPGKKPKRCSRGRVSRPRGGYKR